MKAELFPVKSADLPSSCVLRRVNQNMFISEREKIRTFPHLSVWYRVGKGLSIPYPLGQRVEILPFLCVFRTIEQHGAPHLRKSRTDTQIPSIAFLPRKRITETSSSQSWRRRI